MSTEQEFLQWAVSQGVAVGMLVWVMVRLDVRMVALQTSVDKLLAYLQGQGDARKK
jgi:hypothetical protein